MSKSEHLIIKSVLAVMALSLIFLSFTRNNNFMGIIGGATLGVILGIEIANKIHKIFPLLADEETFYDLEKFLKTGQLTEHLAGVLKKADKFNSLFK